MVDFRLYLITNRHVSKAWPIEDAVDEACRSGVRAVQIREKDLDARSLHDLAVRLRRITASRGASLLVNDRVDIAMAVGADGIHSPENGFPPRAARRLAGGSILVGASAHSLERARGAEQEGADFVTFGPVFDTPSKREHGPPQGLEQLRRVADGVEIPVFAIGGVTPERALQCIQCGARGVAVISSVLASNDIDRTVRQFESALGTL
jgi:thiamine-phosphate pyrophosphorylase